jgi:exopolyphosphatase/guanosine-5'-triphosphate,3'-diphosphate pyrophosphatase
VCDRSLREGVIVDWMLAHGLSENRWRYQFSIRQRSIMHMANKYQVNLEQSERTAAFALHFIVKSFSFNRRSAINLVYCRSPNRRIG